MNEPRYQELLGRVLDEETTPAEIDELTQALRHEPTRLRDFQFHLVLWELFSQQRRPERSADAFVAAWRTRLAAEGNATTFIEHTLEQLGTSQPQSTIADMPDVPLLPAPGTKGLSIKPLFAHFAALVRSACERRWAVGFTLACCLAVMAGFGFWWLGPTVDEPVLAEIQGGLMSLEREGRSVPAAKGTPLQPGDVLRTPERVTATINFAREKTRIILTQGADVKFLAMSHGKQFVLEAGKIEAVVARQRPFRPMKVVTPMAEARVLGTKFSLLTTSDSTRLEVTEGTVRLTRSSDAVSTKVSAGHYAVVATNTVLAPLPLTGSIFREYWTNVFGVSWTTLATHTNYPSRPDGREYLTNLSGLEIPSESAHDYGQRLRGYVHPPRTGDYTFWIAAQDDGSLFLSPDDNPEHRVHMAHSGGTGRAREPRDWMRDSAQETAAVNLTAGKKYYFEVMHKVNADGDYLGVAWQGPGREREVIPGEFLSPFEPESRWKRE